MQHQQLGACYAHDVAAAAETSEQRESLTDVTCMTRVGYRLNVQDVNMLFCPLESATVTKASDPGAVCPGHYLHQAGLVPGSNTSVTDQTVLVVAPKPERRTGAWQALRSSTESAQSADGESTLLCGRGLT